MEIPEDLVLEILTKLPVKSILRFKSVCKHWYTLIQNPNFITQHYNHNNNTTHLLVHHITHRNSDTVFTLFNDGDLSKPQDLHYPKRSMVTHVAGPIKGLFLLQHGYVNRCIWNPATRESRPLPKLNPNFPSQISRWSNAFGFGLNPLTGDYKLIIVEFHWFKNEPAPADPAFFIPAVGIYNFASDSWNHLDAKIPSSLTFKDSSVCVHGHLYWLSKYMSGRGHVIIAFDMRNDKFREVQVPPGSIITRSLSVFSDNIAIFSKTTSTYNFWVMEVEGYWTKRFSVGYLPELGCPIKLWKDNELFFENKLHCVTLYNTSTGKTRDLGIYLFSLGNIFQYKESLVSFKSNSEKPELRGVDTSNLGGRESQSGIISTNKENIISVNSGYKKSKFCGL